MVVKRYINGQTVRHIERLNKIWASGTAQADAYFLDGGDTITNSPAAATITGAHWLEGETVSVLVDGASHPDVTIEYGAATLDVDATTVTFGYSYNSDGQLLPLEGGTPDGSAEGKKKKVRRLGFRLLDTLGFKYGDAFTNLSEIIESQWGDDYGSPPPLFSGVHRVSFEGDHDIDPDVCWRCDGPFPGTLSSIMPQFDVADDT